MRTSFRALVWRSVSILVLLAACPALAQDMTPGSACSVAGAYNRSSGPELSGAGHFMICNGSVWTSFLNNSAAGGVELPYNVAFSGDVSPASIAANQNNYAPTGHATASVLRLTASGAYNITGLQGGADGRILTVTNIGANAITLTNEGAASTAANRFALSSNIALAANQSAVLLYDSTSSRWRAMAVYGPGGAASAGGANTHVQYNSGGVLAGSSNFTYDGIGLNIQGATASTTPLYVQYTGDSGSTIYATSTGAGSAAINARASINSLYGVYGEAVASGLVYGVYGVTSSSTGYGVYSASRFGAAEGLQFIGDISPASISASQNNYNPASLATASVLRLTASGAYNITGLQGGTDGRVLTVTNIGTNVITLTSEDAASTAANRFALSSSIALAGNQSAVLLYDSTSSRWRAMAVYGPGGAASASGSNRNMQFNNAGVLGGVSDFNFNTDGSISYYSNSSRTAGSSFSLQAAYLTSQPGSAQSAGSVMRSLLGESTVHSANAQQIRAVQGVAGTAENSGTGPVENLTGTTGYAITDGAAAVNTMRGSWSGISADAGTVSAAEGLAIVADVNGAAVTTVTGIAVALNNNSCTTANRYGVYLSAPTGTATTSDWGFYQAGTQNNRLGGGLLLAADLSPASIGASQNDYAPTGHATAAVLRLTASAAYNITGLAGGADGRLLVVTNVGSNNITLVSESASSSAANRFALVANLPLVPNMTVMLLYDSVSSRWRRLE